MQSEKEYGAGLRTARHSAVGLQGRALINEGLAGLAYAGAAYLLGGCRLFFGTYPLGIALLCAAPVRIPFILAGLTASAFSGTKYPAVMTAAYVLALILRVVTRIFIDTADLTEPADSPAVWLKRTLGRLFNENVYLRMTASSVCAFIVSLYTIIAGGYHYYDLFGALFSIAAAPAAVRLFSWRFAGETKKKRYKYMAGSAALLAALCFAARELTVLGISAAAFGAFFATLYICVKRGVLEGAAAGLICGVAYEPLYAPLFVLAAIVCGMLYGISPVIATIAAFIAGMTWGLYIDGLDALTRLLPGILLAAAAFYGAERAGLLKLPSSHTEQKIPNAREEALSVEAEWERQRAASDEQRLLDVSESFASLSEVFYNLSDRLRRPGIIDLRRICDSAFDKCCPGCAGHDICWGLEYSASLDMISRLSGTLHERGRVEPDCLGEHSRKRCTRLSEICDDINAACASLTEAVLKSEKIGIFALDYEAMSRILCDTVEEQRADYCRSEDVTARAEEALRKHGIEPEALIVYGTRRKFICARGMSAECAKTDAGRIRAELERVCGCSLEDPLFEFYGGRGQGRLSMTLTTRRRYCVARVSLCVPAEEDGVCGDSVCMFENGRDYFYAVVSDGMGTGSEAAFSSGICTMFLEKMLMSGNRTATALRMLNGVLRSKGGAREMECSATVDLLTVDLLSGAASVIKSGAAPTYIRRGGDIFRLHSKTVPVGILTALDAQQTNLEVNAGDVIVMVSDGVSDVEGGEWLPDLLGYEWEDDLDRMAKKIVGRARSKGSRDDITAVLVKIGVY